MEKKYHVDWQALNNGADPENCIKQRRRKTKTGGHTPDEISYKHMIGTAPAESQAKYEAMFMWQELPTNDRTVEWNIGRDSAHYGPPAYYGPPCINMHNF